MFIKIIILIFCLSLSLYSCQTMDSRGQFVDDTAIEKIKGQALTKEQVQEILGTPSLIPIYSPDSWYYVHRFMVSRAWFYPKVVSQRILRVTFCDNHMKNIELLDAQHNDDVSFIKEYTPAYGTDESELQKFVKNIGKFNKPNEKKRYKRRVDGK